MKGEATNSFTCSERGLILVSAWLSSFPTDPGISLNEICEASGTLSNSVAG